MPFAGLLAEIIASKFEWQFKYRDEGDVNAPPAERHAKMREVRN
jgi:hypothetical protein